MNVTGFVNQSLRSFSVKEMRKPVQINVSLWKQEQQQQQKQAPYCFCCTYVFIPAELEWRHTGCIAGMSPHQCFSQ